MAITHTFKGYKGYGYYGYIENNQLVLGESWPHEGGEFYRGTYEGAVKHLEWLKTKAPRLYNSIEKYFTLHDPDYLHSNRPLKAGDLKPGDKFIRNDEEYLLIDFTPSECFLSTAIFSCFVFALNLSTYKVVGIDKDWEVKLAT